MKGNEPVLDLIREIKKTQTVLAKIDSFYQEFTKNDLPLLGKKETSAIVVAEIMVDFYTCLETLFLRISRFFENRLQKEKWHADLLHKMTLEIEEYRLPVISDEVHSILLEFLKFRHFRRYYFEFNYDWDKIEFLEKKYSRIKPLLERDLKKFLAFLQLLDWQGEPSE
ncbi:MAG: hypothetical protein QME81_00875 [bacterium]|nr:hypothetical protein [bacterium]